MSEKKALITGSLGLVGCQAVEFFIERGFEVVGLDNDMRAYFFGAEASTAKNREYLKQKFKDKYIDLDLDIRSKKEIERVFQDHTFDLIIHAAAQPSHDWAAREPFTDFSVNADGTLNLLENFRRYAPEAVFIFTSTNKVYGDRPNSLPFQEQETRWDLPSDHKLYNGIDESMSVDSSLHSLFGVSKLAADILVQEYGRYFGLKTVSFRGGCLSGPLHQGAELHGFLVYLAKCIVSQRPYTIYGYKGKQVRDNIHSFDLANAFWHFYNKPTCGQIYNIGGSRYSHISLKEAVAYFEGACRKKANLVYSEANRRGDHIWYVSCVDKFKSHYPQWDYQYDIYKIMDDICLKGSF